MIFKLKKKNTNGEVMNNVSIFGYLLKKKEKKTGEATKKVFFYIIKKNIKGKTNL